MLQSIFIGLLCVIFSSSVLAGEITIKYSQDAGAAVVEAKQSFNARTGRSLTNAQYVKRAVRLEVKRERNVKAVDDAVAGVSVIGWDVCGDDFTDEAEMCDDGNTISNDGCNSACTSTEVCGNGYTDPAENCDDGNVTSCDGCKGDCSRFDSFCGDGIAECGEACDDGNNLPDDGCESDCTVTPTTTTTTPTTTTTL